MALIQCPECNKEISDAVNQCPFCGYPIKNKNVDWSKIKIIKLNKKQGLLSIIAISLLIVCFACVGYFTGNVAKAKKYYDDNAYDSFVLLEKKMQKKEKERFGNYLEKEVSEIISNFERGRITGDDAIDKMENLIKYSNKSMVSNYSDGLSSIKSLKISRESYKKAKEAENNKDYITAYNNYAKVIKRDEQYSVAQEKLKTLEKQVVESYKSDAATKASAGDYDGAISAVNGAIKIDGENAELKSLLEQYETKKEDAKKAAEAAERAKALLTNGKVITGSEIQATFKGASITKNIYPDSRSGYYTYYHPQDDTKIYLDIVFRIKNISNYPKNLESIISNVTATYNSSYTYKSYNCYYSDSSDIDPVYSWDTIDALGTYTFHLAIAMPEEIAKTNYPITVEFTLDGEKQILEFR